MLDRKQLDNQKKRKRQSSSIYCICTCIFNTLFLIASIKHDLFYDSPSSEILFSFDASHKEKTQSPHIACIMVTFDGGGTGTF